MNKLFNTDYSKYWDNYNLCIQKINEDINNVKDNEKLYPPNLYIEILQVRINLNYQYSHYNKALKDIAEVINITNSTNTKYKMHIIKGNIYVNIKKYSEADDCYNKAISIIHTGYIGYTQKAYLYYRMEKYSEAIKYYDIAIKNGSTTAFYYKALIYYKIKNYNKAVKYIDKYFENKKDYNFIDYYHKAVYYGAIDKLYIAYDNFIKGLETDNNSTKYLIDLALIIENKDFDSKLEELTEKVIYYDFKIKDDIVKNNTLYKYRNIDINTIKLLQNKSLRLSNFHYFNDPADPPIKLNISYMKKISKYINSIKIASLSADNDNILMWSHYANNHQGICIEYDITNYKELNKNIKNIILKKVKYTNKISVGYYGHVLETENYNQRFIDLFYLKHKNWKYENEYRIISYKGPEEINLTIKAIYFGMNTTEDNIELIKNIVKDEDIKFYKMKPNEKNLYKLDCEELE